MLPFNDHFLNNAMFLNFERKDEYTFNSVEFFFCAEYSDLLNFTQTQMDRLQEFTDYQLLGSEIPDAVWKEALIYEVGPDGNKKQHHRMDII